MGIWNHDEEMYICPECYGRTLELEDSKNGNAKCTNEECGFIGFVQPCAMEGCPDVDIRPKGYKLGEDPHFCSDCIDLHS